MPATVSMLPKIVGVRAQGECAHFGLRRANEGAHQPTLSYLGRPCVEARPLSADDRVSLRFSDHSRLGVGQWVSPT